MYMEWGRDSFRIKRLKEHNNHAAIFEPFLETMKDNLGALGKFKYRLGIG